MNRTLKRPMFRMGGSTGTGITSGLMHLDNNTIKGDIVKSFQTTRKAMFDEINPNQRSGFMPGSVSSFLTNFGLNLMSATPSGNILQLQQQLQKILSKQFQAARAQEMADRKAIDQAA